MLMVVLLGSPQCPDILLPVPGVDGDEGLDVPHGVDLGADHLRCESEEVALEQS